MDVCAGGTPQTSTKALGPAAARFPLWAATAAEFGALAGQKAAHDPQWVWDVPRYRSIGVLRFSVLRALVFSHLKDPPARPVKQVALFGCCVALPDCPRSINVKGPVPLGGRDMFGALGRVSAVLWVVWTTLEVRESPRGRRRQFRRASTSAALVRQSTGTIRSTEYIRRPGTCFCGSLGSLDDTSAAPAGSLARC